MCFNLCSFDFAKNDVWGKMGYEFELPAFPDGEEELRDETVTLEFRRKFRNGDIHLKVIRQQES